MKITFFSHSSILCGAGRSLYDLVKGMQNRGVECHAVLPTFGPLAERLSAIGCAVHYVTGDVRKVWQWVTPWEPKDFYVAYDFFAATVVPEVSNFNPDFILTQTITLPWGAMCAERLGVPHILSAREYGELDHGLQFNFGFEPSISALYKGSAKILCITEDVANRLFPGDDAGARLWPPWLRCCRSWLGLVAGPLKCEVIYSGIELADFPEGIDADLGSSRIANFFAGNPDPVVATIGTIQQGKGQLDLVRAVTALLNAGLRLKCLLVGIVVDQSYKDEVLQAIDASGHPECFVMLDYIEDIYPIIKRLDILVSCSRMEALGRTLIEASILGRPVIYTDKGGPAEIFQDGVHGLSYQHGDHEALAALIRCVLENPLETENRVERAKRHCLENYNNTVYADKAIGAIQSADPDWTSDWSVSRFIHENLSFYKYSYRANPLVYLYNGSGYSENAKILIDPIPWGKFEISLEFSSKDINQLRFDPVEGALCEISNFVVIAYDDHGIVMDKNDISISNNGRQESAKIFFENTDSQIEIKSKKFFSRLILQGNISKVSSVRLKVEQNHLRIGGCGNGSGDTGL